MSITAASGCGCPGTSFARKIAPAQVPHTGIPSRTRSRSFGMISYRAASLPIVVLSPPGMMSASMSSSCSGRRTSIASAPMRRSVLRCSAKSPWRPRTPTRALAVVLPPSEDEGMILLIHEDERRPRRRSRLPAADGKAFGRGDRLERDAAHRLAEAARHFSDELRVGVVRRRLDDRLRAARGIAGLEDARSDEVALGTELHHQRGVGRRRDPTRAEEDHRKTLVLRDALDELERHAILARLFGETALVEIDERLDLRGDRAQVAHGLDDIAGARLALAANHRSALIDAAQRLTEVARPADERHLEVVLTDVELLVRRGEHFALIYVVDAERLEHARLDEVPDAALRHHRDRDRLHDLEDLLGIAHARDAARRADVRGHALERHDGDGTRILGDLRVLGGDHVHDHAALEHLREAGLESPRTGLSLPVGTVLRGGQIGRASCRERVEGAVGAEA